MKKHQTEEERKAARAAYLKQYRADHKEAQAVYMKQYYQDHKEERKEAQAAYMKQYYQDHKETMLEQNKQYRLTPFGRAANLASGYRVMDKKAGRSETTIDAQWIVGNVFSGQHCVYCGESDWRRLGCDRKNSELPHTPENCVPCCKACNEKKGTTPYEEYMNKLDKKEDAA